MSDNKDKYLPYRGAIKAIEARNNSVFFITHHEENIATPLYQLDLDKMALSELPIVSGANALLVTESDVWVGNVDGRIFHQEKLLTQLKVKPDHVVTAMVVLEGGRLGVLAGDQVDIINATSGALLQSLPLPEIGTAIASDASGQWIAVGTAKGTVLVYDNEDAAGFTLSETDKLHEGAVTALAFDPVELRFLSAGNDNQLLLTHARGKLEPEDRGRGVGHNDNVSAIVQTPGERFITGSGDKSCKSWVRSGGTRPSTCSDNVGAVVDMAIAYIHERPHLVVASEDCIRVITLDAAGKFGHLRHRLHDAYEYAQEELSSNDVACRQLAIKRLAEYGDKQSLALLNQQAQQDRDHGLRKLSAQLIGQSPHTTSVSYLERFFNHKDEMVRISAFTCLKDRLGVGSDLLRSLSLALKAGKEDVGKLAVETLEAMAQDDDRAMTLLIGGLESTPFSVRAAALLSLEAVNPEANTLAVSSTHGDLRRASLIRMHQRNLLQEPVVQSTLRRRLDDSNSDVRQTAFLVSLLTRPMLVKAVRERDKNIHRHMFDIESYSIEPDAKIKAKEPPKTRKAKLALEAADYAPLLQATASLSLDTCLLGAHCLALLNDPRAFGLLLQLSREEDKGARVKVCHALAALNDKRADQRLQTLLNDSAIEVRDAAYTALGTIHEKTAFLAVQLGFVTQYPDIRRRALQTLIRQCKKSPPSTSADKGWTLFIRALHDDNSSVRTEAFKAVLNLQLGGSHEAALRFALHSSHGDIRREVQTELIAQASQAWAWSLLLSLLDDPDSNIREETLVYALKKTKGRDLLPLASALQSRYSDTRLQAVEALVKKPSAASQKLLIGAVDDTNRDVRKRVISALVDADSNAALKQAMCSEHDDVKLQAAVACARLGNGEALAPLMSFVTDEKPEESAAVKQWQSNVVSALAGLSLLASPECINDVVWLLENSSANIRESAAHTLMWCIDESHREVLDAALRHKDDKVKLYAALGLAMLGDALAMQLALDHSKSEAEKRLCIGALLAFGDEFSDRLTFFLDDSEESIRVASLITQLLLEYKSLKGTPVQLLAVLSAATPNFRLVAAYGIESFQDKGTFASLLEQLFNDRASLDRWKIAPSDIELFAEIVAFGTAHLRARTLQLLEHLRAEKQDLWDLAWRSHQRRYASEIEVLVTSAKKRKPAKLSIELEELQQIAFGTYCGLVREQGGMSGRRKVGHADSTIIAVRQAALTRLGSLCERHKNYADAAHSVFIQALGDPNQVVRLQALEQLHHIGVDTALLAGECLQTGHNDLGVKALELLTEGESAKKGRLILQQAMVSRTDDLALEAAKLLVKLSDPVTAAKAALDAVNVVVRLRAIEWLVADYDNPKAKKLLYAALKSRHQEVKESCAHSLALKKDPKALDSLVVLLQKADAKHQQAFIRSLVRLGDPAGAEAMLDRIEHDPSHNAAADRLLDAVGGFRLPEIAPRLLGLLEANVWRRATYHALVKTSGFDQRINDPDEECVDQTWLEKQFPRHDAVLTLLLNHCLQIGETELILPLLEGARWSQSDAVNDSLATLAKHANDDVRRAALYALGWRLRKRAAKPAIITSITGPIIGALSHQDPVTQFWAAHALAKVGNNQGIGILLSAIDTMVDLEHRQLAVQVLGELADDRALDSLLAIANDDEHALQEEAAEAIGHLGLSDKAKEIFDLLTRFLGSDRWMLVSNALRGLRYFNTREGWQLVREKASDKTFYDREVALEMLGYNDDPATKDLLLLTLASKDSNYCQWGEAALESARRLFGVDSLEPDLAFLCCGADDVSDNSFGKALARVCSTSDAENIFRILPKCGDSVCTQLGLSLLNKETLPIGDAVQILSSSSAKAVDVAATVIGYGNKKPTKKALNGVEVALSEWALKWDEQRESYRKNTRLGAQLNSIAQVLQRLMWTIGRMAGGTDKLIELAKAHYDDVEYSEIRLVAFTSLVEGEINAEVEALMADAVFDKDSRIRAVASRVLSAASVKQVENLAKDAASDRQSYLQLCSNFDAKELHQAGVENAHRQGVVLPSVIKAQGVEPLLTAALNEDLDENIRRGAFEALAQLASEKGEAALVSIATHETIDEDLAKMAWRCLRRSKRSQSKQHTKQQALRSTAPSKVKG
ncbi:hypothetical protein A9Q99_19935 [Gammaproteobacteria bacterium 45_16_T64]|nr:hypothetical protein A9Q99_19935 [Gammaproteobacteria bacterium 45_16_T64]